jgi:hypothetical protein
VGEQSAIQVLSEPCQFMQIIIQASFVQFGPVPGINRFVPCVRWDFVELSAI